MKKLFIIVLIVFGILFRVNSFAQTYNMACPPGPTTINTCTGNFNDGGGAGGGANAYPANQNCAYTFCSNIVGQCISINFQTFNVNDVDFFGNPYDYLKVYDGASTASPVLVFIWGGPYPAPFPLAGNGSCLTLEFISDGSVQTAGWTSIIDCQPCPIPPSATQQNCTGAIPICQEQYNQPYSYSGDGPGPDEIDSINTCLSSGEQNDVWYVFTPQTSGILNFILTPLYSADDYDFAVYNITNGGCPGITTGASPVLTCNWSNQVNVWAGQTGVYGGPPYNGVGNNITWNGLPWNQNLAIVIGQTYVLNVSNFSGSQGGYFLDFSPSSANLFDNIPPQMISISPVSCNQNTVTITFSEPILCSTIQATDFTITGPGGSYTVLSATAISCTGTGVQFTQTVTLTASPSFSASGIYNVNLLGIVTDLCGNVALPASIPFTLTTISNAGVDQSLCGSFTAVLAANSPAPGIGMWTLTNGPGTASFSNSLSPVSSVTVSVLGTYIFQWAVTNGGCAVTDQVSITFGSFIVSVSPLTPTICLGQSSILTANGALTYTWSPSAGLSATIGSMVNANPLINTVYTVTGFDVNGCSQSTTVTVIVRPIPNIVLNASNASCGNPNGFIINTTNGGGAPYTFSWSNGQTIEDLSGLLAGIYTVTATNSFGCTSSASITVNSVGIFTASYTQINANCFGGTNGSINVSPQLPAVNGPYSYLWNTGATTQDLNNLTAGTYSITISNSVGCTNTLSATIISAPQLSLIATPTNIFCTGLATGTLDLSVFGGTPTYTYLWSNGATTQDVVNLLAGNFSVTVTDANNCSVTAIYIVIQLPSMILSQTNNNSTCGLGNGNVDLMVNGNGPFTYLWNNSSTNQDLSFVGAGAYSVTVTDLNNCTGTLSVNINNTVGPSLVFIPLDATCNGGSTGSITLLINGGVGPFIYSWDNGATTQNLNSIPAGTYIVDVTDNNNCHATGGIILQEPLPLVLANTYINSTCGLSNAAIDLTVSGAISPYTYLWSTSAITEDLSGVGAGIYTVTVTDFNGCTGINTATILNISGPTLSEIHNNVLCSGNNSGTINLTVFAGLAPYLYLWNNSATTEDLTNLTSGSYSVTVTDFNNCQSNLTVNISEPSTLILTEIHIDANCGNATGSINLSVSGGVSPFIYLWNNSATTQDLTSIFSSVYSVTVTDFNNCTISGSITVLNLSAPILSDSYTDVSCFGNNSGSINITAINGTQPYSYLWNNGSTLEDLINLFAGSYIVTVTDLNNCQASISINIVEPQSISISETHINAGCGVANGSIDLNVTGGMGLFSYIWNNSATTQDVISLLSGSYIVTVTDANNCSSSTTVTILNGSGLNLTETHVNATCGNFNGSINLTVLGGTNPYSYFWSNGLNTQDLFNLTGGLYSVTVFDFNNCSATISIAIQNGIAMILQAVTTDVSCFGFNDGAIDLSVSGGAPSYSYFWSNNTTTQDLTGMAGNNYDVTVTDMNGCTKGLTINLVEHAPLIPSQTHVNETCGQSNGSINLSVFGGYFPYNYLWSTGVISQNLIGISAGNYSVTVTDFNSCTAVLSVVVAGTAGPLTQFISTNVLCFGSTNGQIDLSVIGGTLPYTYIWSNNSTNQDINNLSPGNYFVTVTDANNCLITGNVIITEPIQIQLSETHINVLCSNLNASIDLSVVGGISPYSYSWSNAVTTQDLNSLGIGIYDVTVFDSNSCSASLSVNVINGGGTLPLSFTSIDETCSGINGSIDLNVNAGTAPYSFSWSNFATTEDVFSLIAANYTVTVTDISGCSGMISVLINNYPSTQLSETHINETCGGSNGSIDLLLNGGTMPISYLWNNNSITQDLSFISAGNFSVTVTDANNCSVELSIQILNLSGPIVNQFHSDENCGQTNGSIDLIINNGLSPYVYLWNTAATTQDLINLSAANYSVTITDANGCSVSQSIIINNIAGPQLIESHVSTSCGLNNGSIDLSVIGGTLPFIYIWSNNSTSQDLQNIPANTYVVTVTDAGGCSVVFSGIIINSSTSIQINEIHTSSTCGNANAFIDITVLNGVSPFIYLWNNNSVVEDLFNISSGNYSVTVADNLGCSSALNILVNDIQGPILVVLAIPTSCGNDDGSIDLTLNGGTSSFSYLWSNGETTEDLLSLAGGVYFVSVTDANGCIVITNTTVIASLFPVISANISGNNGCIPLNVLFINNSSNAATYNWLFGDGSSSNVFSPTHQYNQTGSFPVLLIETSPTGCSDTLVVDTVFIYETPIADFISAPWINESTLLSLAQFQFTNQSLFASTYLWSFGDGNNSFEVNPSYTYTTGGSFYVTLYAFNDNGCADTITYGPLILLADGDVFIPNTFTPNDDQQNDFFKVYGTGITSIHLWIYDRWGEKLYEELSESPSWNGVYQNTKLNLGVYIYQVEIIRYDGSVLWKKGDVTLLR